MSTSTVLKEALLNLPNSTQTTTYLLYIANVGIDRQHQNSKASTYWQRIATVITLPVLHKHRALLTNREFQSKLDIQLNDGEIAALREVLSMYLYINTQLESGVFLDLLHSAKTAELTWQCGGLLSEVMTESEITDFWRYASRQPTDSNFTDVLITFIGELENIS